MKKTIFFVLALLLPWSVAGAGNKHVVELFTSQGCYSCPPAERLLGELIDSRDDIVALEFHVDYWNDLVYGTAGKWTDPFSKAAYTLRQRQYKARGLEGNDGVYTPQAVVDGRTAVVGSNERALTELLNRPVPSDADVRAEREGSTLRVAITGESAGAAEVWLYIFDDKNVTKVEAGENKGKTLVNHHVVTETRRLGEWRGGKQVYAAEELYLVDGERCAVVVQRPDQGAVIGAELCPA